MKHYLPLAILLVGCGCAQQPIMQEAQLQMSVLMGSYELAHKVELKFCHPAHLLQVCLPIRRAGYDVEAAITTANGTRSEETIAEAQRKMGAYEVAVSVLL